MARAATPARWSRSPAGAAEDGWRTSCFARGGRAFALLGEPGSGKSTLLRALALDRIEAALASDDPPEACLPLLIPLPEYRHPIAWLREVTDGRGYPPGIADQVAEHARVGRVLFLLDGLDEVEPAHMREMLASVRALICDEMAERGCRVVITSRFFGYQPPAQGVRELQLLALEADAQRELLDRQLGGDAALAQAVMEQIEDAGLGELAGNPFLLTLVALVARAHVEDADTGEGTPGRRLQLPRKRPELLARATTLLLEGRPGRAGHVTLSVPSVPLVTSVLEDLALALLREGAGPYAEALVHRAPVGSEEVRGASRGLGGEGPHSGALPGAGRGLLGAAPRRPPHGSRDPLALPPPLASGAPRLQGGFARLGPTVREEDARRVDGRGDALALGQWAETFALLAAEVGREADALCTSAARPWRRRRAPGTPPSRKRRAPSWSRRASSASARFDSAFAQPEATFDGEPLDRVSNK